jgi:hypothetical protein
VDRRAALPPGGRDVLWLAADALTLCRVVLTAVLGFVASGWLPGAVGVVVVAGLLGAFPLTRNEALSMLLQATGYGLVLWRTWRDGLVGALSWLLAVMALIAVVDRRVLWERSLPTFLGGLADVLRGRRSH